jgi:hypothetical protein
VTGDREVQNWEKDMMSNSFSASLRLCVQEKNFDTQHLYNGGNISNSRIGTRELPLYV